MDRKRSEKYRKRSEKSECRTWQIRAIDRDQIVLFGDACNILEHVRLTIDVDLEQFDVRTDSNVDVRHEVVLQAADHLLQIVAKLRQINALRQFLVRVVELLGALLLVPGAGLLCIIAYLLGARLPLGAEKGGL